MKQLFNETNGRSLDVAFTEDTSNEAIAQWVNNNLDEVEDLGVTFQEIHSCEASIGTEENIIEINGDEDLQFLRVRNLRIIGNHADVNGLIS